jgi:hypothetical protein
MPPSNTLPLTIALAVSLTLFPARVRAADEADDARARARDAEARGDLGAAARALRPAVEAFPQDYELALELADLEARSGHSDEAIRSYRDAAARSPAAEGARVGLVSQLARTGRCEDAATELGALGASTTTMASVARDEVASCNHRAPGATIVTFGAAYDNLQFTGHRYKSSADGATAFVDLGLGAWSLGVTGRYLSIHSRDTSVLPAFAQQEGYARLGTGNATFGASLLFGVVHDGSGSLGTSIHAGTALRYSPLGDLVLTGTVSAYTDQTILRVSPSYRAALGYGLSLTPAVAVQRAGDGVWGSGSLTFGYDSARWGASLGGRYGEEVRPASLADAYVYAVPEHVMWGTWAAARVQLTSRIQLRASYAVDRLQTTTDGVVTASYLQSLTVGPAFTF